MLVIYKKIGLKGDKRVKNVFTLTGSADLFG